MISSVILLILGFGLPFGYFYFTKNPHFGGKITKEEKERLQQSKQWRSGIFQNQSKTTMEMNLASLPGLIRESIQGRKSRNPEVDIPIEQIDSKRFLNNDLPKFVWYGHATLLLQINGRNLLIDPMFGSDASPVGPVRTRRFSKNSLKVIADLPHIDAILMTHDHYDHLDFESMRLLKKKVGLFLVPLGVGRHLEYWGIEKDTIHEVDWWEETTYFELDLIFTPSRHFSGRGVFDRAKSLWGGWVIKNAHHSIYLSGDGGYDSHFKTVGDRFGPFDWGFIECGQYNERWHQIHLYPEESVQAAIDAKVNMAIPIHWGAFSLALHHWKDPITRFVIEADKKQLPYLSSRPGVINQLGDAKNDKWWDSYR